MERKATERKIIAGLIVLLVVEVSLLAMHLGWGGFRKPVERHDAVLAGHVLKNENQLRRRGSGSLVWEKSGGDDPLYYYDSILTLAQSTASLNLFKDTEVHLSENTLVTIEPQDKKGYGEIRLKFVRGNLRARNPFANARVDSDTWSMEIKTGSEIDFRQTGDGSYELGVQKGEVNFTSASGQETVGGAQMLRIQDGAPIRMQVDDSLRWTEAPPERVYTHNGVAKVKLQWANPGAEDLVLQTLGQSEKRIPLGESERSHELTLPLGQHNIYLRAQEKTSQALKIEVWRAPLLHLVSPLPRNRVRTGEPTDFVWMSAPGISGYKFILNGRNQKISKDLGENSFSTSFSQEDDAEWSVEAKDPDGFLIPSLYSYPLYIREAPLAAPKLHSPTLRKPAASDKGAAYWIENLLFPQAHADEILYQALFNWEKVEGADRYVIEISESADFRAPLVNKTVTKNEFIWKKMELKSYYWRVAAQTKSGRLGIFSEPEMVDLAKSEQTGVAVTPLEPEKVEPPAKPELPAKPEPPVIQSGSERVLSPAPAPPPLRKFELKPSAFLEWNPGYDWLSVSAPEKTKASLAGVALSSFTIGADRNLAAERMVRLQMHYARFRYQAKPKTDFPMQEDLKWSEISGQAVSHKSSSHWGYGIYLDHSAEITRKDSESVQVRGANYLGPVLEGYYEFGSLLYVADYMALVGSSSGVLIRQAVRAPLWHANHVYFGAGIEAGARFKSGGHAYSVSGYSTLGFEF